MGSFDTSKSEQLASSIHEAFNTKGDAKAHQEKFKAAQKMLAEATHGTAGDRPAQKQVVQAINERIKADGFCAEGYGNDGQSSYLIMRPLNYGDAHKSKSVYYCPVSSDGKFNMQEIPRGNHGQDKQPAHKTTDQQSGHKAPEKQPGHKTTEQQPGHKTTEQQPGHKTTEQQPGRKAPEQQPGQKAPEQQPGQKAPEQQPGQKAPEQLPVSKAGTPSRETPDKHSEKTTVPGPVPPATGLLEAGRKSIAAVESSARTLDAPVEVPRSPAETFQQAVAQSNYFGQQHEVSGQIRDGFRDGGKYSTYDASGEPTTAPRRQITVVDRASDPVLQDTIAQARERFGSLPPQQKAAALTDYVHDLMTPREMNSAELDSWYGTFSRAHRGETVMLGEFISQGKGVCSQQATLLKVLGDELGLDMRLVRGTGLPGSPELNHAWTDVQLPGQSERVVYDPRWQVAGERYAQVPAHERGASVVNGASEIPPEPHVNEPVVNRSGSAAPADQVLPAQGNDRIPAFLKNPTVAKGLGGTLGVIGVGAGCYQTYQGFQMINQGDTTAGGLTVAGGVANTGSGVLGLTMLGKTAPAWAGPVATRLGGVGTIIGGGLEIYNGIQTGDNFKIGEGTMYTTTGTLMLAGGATPVGMSAAGFAGSYGATRFVMEHTGGDKAVTWAMDAVGNRETNSTAANITSQNLGYLENTGNQVIGKTCEQIKDSNLTARDVSRVILGLREKMEQQTGDELNASKAEVTRLINLRAQLAKAG
jgi:hypothetical protein